MVGSRYQVKGQVKMDDEWRNYSTIIEASNERRAVEQYYTTIGSKHRLKRNDIRIDGITKIEGEYRG